MKRQAMQWINSLKIATIEEDISAIEKLANSMPKFESKQKAKEALGLIDEAKKIMNEHKEKTLVSIKKLRLTKAYLNSI